jgi:hypothetical protein
MEIFDLLDDFSVGTGNSSRPRPCVATARFLCRGLFLGRGISQTHSIKDMPWLPAEPFGQDPSSVVKRNQEPTAENALPWLAKPLRVELPLDLEEYRRAEDSQKACASPRKPPRAVLELGTGKKPQSF